MADRIVKIKPVRIVYDVEVDDVWNEVELPFVVGVLADLSGQPAMPEVSLAERVFLSIDSDSFDSAMTALQPRARFEVRNSLTGAGNLSVDLTFSQLEDFSPAAILNRVGAFRTLLETRRHVLDSFAEDDSRRAHTVVSEIDGKLTEQLNLILHHEVFQKLEGAWRGLHYLVNSAGGDALLKIRVMSVSRKELGAAVKPNEDDGDESPLFTKIRSEYERPGGEPIGLLLGDFYFDHSPSDVELLGALGRLAAASHAPFIAGASPSIAGVDRWQGIANAPDLTRILTAAEGSAWRSMRDSEEARYVALAMPRMLARAPYEIRTNSEEAFPFEEDVTAGHCWSNAAYAMAVNISRSFLLDRWYSRIQGVESGGRVEGLATHSFPADDGGIAKDCPTEIAIGDRREEELARIGLMPLVHRPNAEVTAFFRVQTVQKPDDYRDPESAVNAILAARLPYVLACCRFAQYVKCIVRDTNGGRGEPEDLRYLLQNWISGYVQLDLHASTDSKAQRPLYDAEVKLDAGDGDLAHICRLLLRPYYQLEGLTEPMEIVIDIRRRSP